jgi:Ca2+-dependent lipid-binding protein
MPVTFAIDDKASNILVDGDAMLHIEVLRARNLPEGSDAYVRISAAGSADSSARTSTRKNQTNPTWGETLTLSFSTEEDLACARVRIDVMDWDLFSRDDLSGRKPPNHEARHSSKRRLRRHSRSCALVPA